MSLRATVSEDMKTLNQKDWGFLVELVAGDTGITYKTDAETGEPLKSVQTLRDTERVIPDDGEDQTIDGPVVVMALSSLERIPQPGETWWLRAQYEPGGALVSKMISGIKAPEDGKSVGFIRLYAGEVSQL